jgi:hypothetical protein
MLACFFGSSFLLLTQMSDRNMRNMLGTMSINVWFRWAGVSDAVRRGQPVSARGGCVSMAQENRDLQHIMSARHENTSGRYQRQHPSQIQPTAWGGGWRTPSEPWTAAVAGVKDAEPRANEHTGNYHFGWGGRGCENWGWRESSTKGRRRRVAFFWLSVDYNPRNTAHDTQNLAAGRNHAGAGLPLQVATEKKPKAKDYPRR